jgi:hypothetical protein
MSRRPTYPAGRRVVFARHCETSSVFVVVFIDVVVPPSGVAVDECSVVVVVLVVVSSLGLSQPIKATVPAINDAPIRVHRTDVIKVMA